MEKQIDITKELSQNFIDFSYEANSCRAFADARDGLKPGQRACLWEMYTNGYTSNKPHVKSAKISGGVIARWWPHGGTAIYETFARMSQNWINNIPEVDWHGGNGSVVISGSPSADRYTEARLSKASEDGLFTGIKKKNVRMVPNFSEDAEWPSVLPAIMPRLMVNGCQGIGVTIANNWLPHRLADITEVIEHYVTTGQLDYSSLAPDFPSGGIIINRDELSNIYEIGKGRAILRAKTSIEGNTISITELPYQVYIEPLIAKIKDMIKDESITGISDIANKTDKKRLLIEIECDGNPSAVLRDLFQKTDLQKTYSANQWALVNKTPKLLTLKDYLDIYIEHNLSCIQKESQYDIEQAKTKLEIALGLIKALEDIDNIITLIKQSESSSKAEEALKAQYEFTDAQTKAIVNMRLGKLAHLEKIELNQEKEELTSTIFKLENLLSSESNLKEELLKRLKEFTAKYDTPRKTQVTNIDISKDKKEQPVIEPKDCVVIISAKGFIKRVDIKNFKPQRRNTVGVKNHGDIIKFSQKTNTQDYLMVFTTKGKMYRLLVDTLPEGTSTSTGAQLTTLIEFDKDELPIAFTTLNRVQTNPFIFFATKKGIVKKVPLEEYDNIKRTGVLAIKLKEGDSLASIALLNQEEVILMTRKGMGIRFPTAQMTISSRTAQGIKGINLSEGDEVIAALPIFEDSQYLTIVSANCAGKKLPLSEISAQARGGKGLNYSKDSEIAGVLITTEEDNIFVSGNKSSLVVANSDVPVTSRFSMGNMLLKNNEKVEAVSKL